MILRWSLTSASGGPCVDWTWQGIISIIWWWYDPCAWYLGIYDVPLASAFFCKFYGDSCAVVIEVKELWKNSVKWDCHFIRHANVKVDSLCFDVRATFGLIVVCQLSPLFVQWWWSLWKGSILISDVIESGASTHKIFLVMKSDERVMLSVHVRFLSQIDCNFSLW